MSVDLGEPFLRGPPTNVLVYPTSFFATASVLEELIVFGIWRCTSGNCLNDEVSPVVVCVLVGCLAVDLLDGTDPLLIVFDTGARIDTEGLPQTGLGFVTNVEVLTGDALALLMEDDPYNRPLAVPV